MSTTFEKKLANLALQQYTKYRLLRENQEPLRSQIEAYWTDLGFPFESVGVAWSAVFVSWCVKGAGATGADFLFAFRHSEFVKAAIDNASAGQGSFFGHSPAAYAPKVGDLLQNNRPGHHFDFALASSPKSD